MGTYENFYLNQIKQLQEENKKLKQIIDEGLVLDAGERARAMRGVQAYFDRQSPEERAADQERRKRALAEPMFGSRKKEKPYASDDMESRRTKPGYGPSSDSPTPGPSGRLTPLSDNMVKRLFPNG
jgi:hypothetical protein